MNEIHKVTLTLSINAHGSTWIASDSVLRTSYAEWFYSCAGLIIINASGTILMVNAAALRMFGYGKGELEGKNVSVLM